MIRETNITVQHGDTVNLLTPSGVRVGHWVFGKVARRDERATVIYRWVLFALLLALAVAMGFNIGKTLSEFLTMRQARSAGVVVAVLAFAVLYTAWMIVGGESGWNPRPMRMEWADSISEQCKAAGVPYFFKQTGNWRAKDYGMKGKGGGDDEKGTIFRPDRGELFRREFPKFQQISP